MSPEQPQSPINKQAVCVVTQSDLPLSCPMPYKEQWDSHPKIYLPILKTEYASCPYCGTVYHLVKEGDLSATSKHENTSS